jgi:prevent-host-death family protein
MKQKTIGIRELKAQLSSRVREVKKGATLVITDRGEPVARLVPVTATPEDRFQQLLDSGMVSWSGQKLAPEVPRVPIRGSKMVSDLLLEDRE